MGNIESPIKRFSKKYKGYLLHLLAEEYLCFICRYLPGLEGMLLRRMIYAWLFKSLGKSSIIYAGAYLTHTYGIEAGDYFSINTGAMLDGRGGIKMGDGVMIGPYAIIVSSTHHFDKPGESMTSLNHIEQPVTIGDDVWIGAHAFLKGGVIVGSGSIIGAGAIVLDDVPEYTITAGNPAKAVRKRRCPPTETLLNRSSK